MSINLLTRHVLTALYIKPRELEIDPRTGMKNYIGNEQGSWDTSRALVRRTLERCIHLGRQHRSSGQKQDEYEAFRLLGQAVRFHSLSSHFRPEYLYMIPSFTHLKIILRTPIFASFPSFLWATNRCSFMSVIMSAYKHPTVVGSHRL